MYTNPKTEDKMREIRRVKINEQTCYMAEDICKRVGIFKLHGSYEIDLAGA